MSGHIQGDFTSLTLLGPVSVPTPVVPSSSQGPTQVTWQNYQEENQDWGPLWTPAAMLQEPLHTSTL